MTTSSLSPRLQPEAGHAEVRVLVGELEIARVVGRLRDAPRHAALGAVRDLPAHDEPAGLLEQAAGRRAHHQRRHQVLEHRSRPRDERRAARHRRQRAAEAEPVRDRHVALGDRDEARQARLRGEQVVAAGVEACRRRRGSRSRTACASGRRGSRSPWRRTVPGRPARRRSRRAIEAGVGRTSMSRAWLSTVARERRVRPHAGTSGRRRASATPLVGDQRRARRSSTRRAARARSSREPRGPRRAGIQRGAPERSPSDARRAPSVAWRCRDGAARRVGASRRVPARRPRRTSVHRVADAGQRGTGAEYGWAAISRQACAERDQMAGEIAAVDRRDVLRLERRAAAGCRTSCRSGRGSARGAASSRASLQTLDGVERCRASRSRARRPWRADTGRCWSATCDARRPGSASSWKLSGGKAWSSGVTKVSKKRHVRRAISRSARRVRQR